MTEVDQKREHLRKLLQFQTEETISKWRAGLGNFLETGYYTRDPKRRKVLRFPSPTERPDLYVMAAEWDRFKLTHVAKSRQVMESNFHLAEPLRDCLCWPQTVWILCSYDEALARELLFDRLTYSIDALPSNVRLRYNIVARPSANRIDFYTRDGKPWHSEIHAAEQGTMSVRQRTPSGVLLDEYGLMLEAGDMYATALAQVQADDDAGAGELTGKLRMLGSVWPDSEQVELLGDQYNEAREAAIAAGWAAAGAAT
jgi:hypothetical protein